MTILGDGSSQEPEGPGQALLQASPGGAPTTLPAPKVKRAGRGGRRVAMGCRLRRIEGGVTEPAPKGRAGIGEQVLPFAAVVLMLIIAAIHQVNVRANELAPDVGGGFGMFAFVDNSGWRTVIVTIEDANGRSWSFDLEAHGRELDLSDREVQRVRSMPSPGALKATANLVRAAPWYVDESGEGIAGTADPGDEPLEVAAVRITVYGVDYDVDRDEVHRKVIASWPVADE